MAKRKSGLLAFINLCDKVSWKFTLPLALLSYFGLHYLSKLPLLPASDLQHFSDTILRSLIVALSNVLQFIVPIALMISAILSVFNSKKRAKLLDSQSSLESIRSMSWQDFELLVGEAFRRQGYQVQEMGGGGPDGGVDLVLLKDGKKSVVQCKRWKTYSVGVSPVRELYGVMVAAHAQECIFVSSGKYTNEAKQFAKGRPIQLIDGPELIKAVLEVQSDFSKIF
jgi:restriction system protein